MTRAKAEDYQRRARECLTAANSASTEDVKEALISMADIWSRLAAEQRDESASIGPPTEDKA